MRRINVGELVTRDYAYPGRITSGTRWKGITLEVGGAASGELPEGVLLSHSAVLTTAFPQRGELYVSDTGWSAARPIRNLVQFFPAKMPFASRWEGDVRAILVQFTSEFLQGSDGEPARLVPKAYWAIESNLLAEIVIALERDLVHGCPSGPLYGECLGAAFVTELFNRQLAADRKHAAKSFPQLANRIDLVVEYINDNLTADLSLIELARLAELSTHHLLRVFKRHTGLTPHRYVVQRRLEWAQFLLSDPRRNISDIAVQTGFSDQSHFSRAFRYFTGVSPRAFRRSPRTGS